MKKRLKKSLCHALLVVLVTAGSSVPFSESILGGYTVTYLPGEHGAFEAQVTSYILSGAPTPAAPATPGEGYWIFDGWDPPVSSVVSDDVIYVAQWREASSSELFSVSFVDWDGSTLIANLVALGGNATPPVNPTREGYTFSGWDKPITDVQKNLVVTAQYDAEEVASALSRDQDNSAIPWFSRSSRSFNLFGLGVIILSSIAIVVAAIRHKKRNE